MDQAFRRVMNRDFLTVMVFVLIGGGFVFAALLAGRFLRPKFGNPDKGTIYECGERPVGQAWFNFNPRFYVIALIFLVFDVALAILFPVLSVIGGFNSAEGFWPAAGTVFVFLGVLVLGLAYVWGKGDLEWIKK
jgi:NADH-quinone oxidoreductase subunit A